MGTIKKVMVGILLVALAMPVYAAGGVYVTVSPGVTYYSQPAYSGSCLTWVPQQVDNYNNWVPGHYVNACYGNNYPSTYYYGGGYNYSRGHGHNYQGGGFHGGSHGGSHADKPHKR